jgi:hypothetical protein
MVSKQKMKSNLKKLPFSYGKKPSFLFRRKEKKAKEKPAGAFGAVGC